MILDFTKISILIKNWAPLFLSLLVLLSTTAMKVHPMPKKRNITIPYDMNSSSLSPSSRDPQEAAAFLGLPTTTTTTTTTHHKKLRRLPHVFSRVLELPFRSDADVSVEESADFFRFVAETDGAGGEIMAHTIEIHPGVTKIVVREGGSRRGELTLDELELDVWRFRLPETTRPELASAVLVDGELIVTVPKGGDGGDGAGDGSGEVWGDGGFGGGNMGGRLVLVQ